MAGVPDLLKLAGVGSRVAKGAARTGKSVAAAEVFSASGKLVVGGSKLALQRAERLLENAILREMKKDAAKLASRKGVPRPAVTRKQVQAAIRSGERGDFNEAAKQIAAYWESKGKVPTARAVDNMARKGKESQILKRALKAQEDAAAMAAKEQAGQAVVKSGEERAARIATGREAHRARQLGREAEITQRRDRRRAEGRLATPGEASAYDPLEPRVPEGVEGRRTIQGLLPPSTHQHEVAEALLAMEKKKKGKAGGLGNLALPALAFGVMPQVEKVNQALGAPDEVRAQAAKVQASMMDQALPPDEELMNLLQKNRARMALLDPESVSRLLGNLAATPGEFVVGAPQGPDILNQVILRSMMSGASAGGQGLGQLDPEVLKTLMR